MVLSSTNISETSPVKI